MSSTARRSQPLCPDMPLKPARCSHPRPQILSIQARASSSSCHASSSSPSSSARASSCRSLPDIPSGPNIPSKPVHHRSQHSKSKSNSAAEVTVLAVVWAAGGARENATNAGAYEMRICDASDIRADAGRRHPNRTNECYMSYAED
ncbi:hypothetical protein BDZ91DRAFT_730000 [Kalaharituber pfeilii]|nr:hypothetical protein BDZ91DRAFT_730000 [Kalaharituber pfeilii]